MKVAIFVPNINQGGTEKVGQLLANFFLAESICVTVITMGGKKYPFKINCSHLSIDKDLKEKPNIFSRRKALIKILKNKKIDCVLSMGEVPNFLNAILPQKYFKVIRLTNAPVGLRGFKGFLIRQAVKLSHLLANKTIVPINALAKSFNLLTDIKPVVEIYNPVSVKKVKSNKFPRYFLNIGQLVEQKDHLFLMKVFKRYCEDGGKRNLVLIGRGEKEICIKKFIENNDLQTRVKMIGWVEDPYKYMTNAVALLFTSKWEGMPNAMIEAMMCGCPVISTDCPTGPREILGSGQYGRLVKLGDSNSYLKELKLIDQDIKWQKYLATKALERSEDFSVKKVGLRFISIFKEARSQDV